MYKKMGIPTGVFTESAEVKRGIGEVFVSLPKGM